MSAFFDPDQHLGDIHEAALRLAPLCTNGIDWANTGGESRYSHSGKADTEIVAGRAWDLGLAFVEQYYRKVDEAGVRDKESQAQVKQEVKHG